jgi:hypothetical protein
MDQYEENPQSYSLTDRKPEILRDPKPIPNSLNPFPSIGLYLVVIVCSSLEYVPILVLIHNSTVQNSMLHNGTLHNGTLQNVTLHNSTVQNGTQT